MVLQRHPFPLGAAISDIDMAAVIVGLYLTLQLFECGDHFLGGRIVAGVGRFPFVELIFDNLFLLIGGGDT